MSVRLLQKTPNKPPRLIARIEGTYPADKNYILFIDTGTQIARSPQNGAFQISIPLNGTKTPLKVFAVSSNGKVETEDLLVDYGGWAVMQARLRDRDKRKPASIPVSVVDNPLKKSNFSSSLGITLLSYSQTAPELSTDFSQTGITFKGSYGYRFNNSFDLGASVFFTLTALTSNPAGVIARSLGVNGRAGYALPWIRAPWRLSLMGGMYFITMFVDPATFGIQNLMGPQVFPTLRYTLSSGNSIGAYFKFSPVGSSFSILALSDREIAAGINYSYKLKSSGQSLQFGVDFSQLRILIDTAQVESGTVSVSVGYGW